MFLAQALFAHGEWAMHYNDVARVFNGFGPPDGKDAEAAYKTTKSQSWSASASGSKIASDKTVAAFYDLFDSISNMMDSMPKKLEIEFGLPKGSLSNPKTHRIFCHGWPLDGEPTEEVLELLEKKYGIPREKILKYWHKYQKSVFAKAAAFTKLPMQQAKSFACLMWDIHILGDLGPDNSEFKGVMKLEELVDDICKRIESLFGSDSSTAKSLCKRLRSVLKQCIDAGVGPKEAARRILQELVDMKIGSRLAAKFPVLKKVWNAFFAVNVNSAEATRKTQEKVSKIAEKKEKSKAKKKGENSGGKAKSANDEALADEMASRTKRSQKTTAGDSATVEKTGSGEKGAHNSGKKSANVSNQGANKSAAKGILQKIITKEGDEYIVLSVHISERAGAAIGAGVLTFILDESMTYVGFARGKMTEEEFLAETGKNLGGGIVVGAACYVTIALGASAGGPVVMAVTIGTYMLYDIVFTRVARLARGDSPSIDECLGRLPTYIQRRMEVFDFESATKMFDYEGKSSGFSYEGKSKGFDFGGCTEGFDMQNHGKSVFE